MHVQDHLCNPHFSARSRVPKLTSPGINMLTWHNQKGIIIVNLSTYIFMIAIYNSTYCYLIVCYAHTKIFLLYMRNISFIFIIIYFIVIYFATWLGKRHLTIYMVSCCYPLAFSRILYLQRCAFYEQVTQDHCQLADPQVQWVGLGWSIPRISVISKVIFSFTSTGINKRSTVCFCYSNPVISTVTATSSTNHHHRSITTKVTPEADLEVCLHRATAPNLLKPVCCRELSTIINAAAFQAPITGPHLAISKVAITCDFWSECFSTQTVPPGLQQWLVTGVITARDFEVSAFQQPKCRGDHVSVNWRIRRCSRSITSVIPPVTTVNHPVFAVVIGEPSNQYPARVTVVTLNREKQVQKQFSLFFNDVNRDLGDSTWTTRISLKRPCA